MTEVLCGVMSRLSFSDKGKCSKADEERSKEGENEIEKGMVWEKLEMDCGVSDPLFD